MATLDRLDFLRDSLQDMAQQWNKRLTDQIEQMKELTIKLRERQAGLRQLTDRVDRLEVRVDLLLRKLDLHTLTESYPPLPGLPEDEKEELDRLLKEANTQQEKGD